MALRRSSMYSILQKFFLSVRTGEFSLSLL